MEDEAKAGEPARALGDDGPLAGFIPIRDWLAAEGAGLFKTYDSLEWWLRQHPEELSKCADYILTPRGRYVGHAFSRFVRGMLKRDSDAKLKRAIARKRARAEAKAARQGDANQPG